VRRTPLRLRDLLATIAALLLAIVPVRTSTGSDWQVVGTEDGITISRREPSGSSITAFRGTGAIDAPVWKIASILLDVKRAPEWVDSLKESRVVRRIAPDHYIEFNHVGMPIIMKDRDFVSDVRIEVDAAARSVALVYAPSGEPLSWTSHDVRGEIVAGLFKATALPSGGSTFTAEVQADPKGFIPAWVVNMFQKNWPVQTFERLRKQAAKPDITVPDAFADVLAPARSF